MVFADIKPGLFDESIEPIIESIPMDIEDFGGQRCIEIGPKERPSRKKQVVGNVLEFVREQGDAPEVPKTHFLGQDVA